MLRGAQPRTKLERPVGLSVRIGLDHLAGVTHAPGVGRYQREFARASSALDHDHELALFEVGGGARVMEPALALGRARRVRCALPRRAVQQLARWTGWHADQWLAAPDLFHTTSLEYPPVSGRTHLSLAVAELPAEGAAAQRFAARARDVDSFVVFCEHYADVLTERFGIARERIGVVPVGCDHWVRDLEQPPAPAAAPQLLVLGALRRAREPLRVLRAFEELSRDEPTARLVFAGRPGDAADDVRAALAASPARARVQWIDEPREADMPALVARSQVLLHLAQDEGSPVTPLEAAALGLELALTRLPAFEEALDDLPHWIAADAPPVAVAHACRTALEAASDSVRRERHRAHAAHYTWQRNAAATLAHWQRQLG